MLGWDFETEPFSPGDQFPLAACLSWADLNGNAGLLHGLDPQTPLALAQAFAGNTAGANTAFDAGVALRNYPELGPAIFDAYDSDRVYDVLIRQQLIDLAEGRLRGYRRGEGGKLEKIGYGLDEVAPRNGFPMPKKAKLRKGQEIPRSSPDYWRRRYNELRPLMLEEWPDDARKYAIDDARATVATVACQQAKAHLLDDQFRQCRADFALKLTSARGLITDPDAVPYFERAIERRIGELRDVLSEPAAWMWSGSQWEGAGLVREDGSRDMKAARARMVAVCQREGIPVKLTPKVWKVSKKTGERYESGGEVMTDADTCEETGDEILKLFGEYAQMIAVKSKDLEFLTRGTREPIHCRYNCILETGRTSSSKPNVQNLRTLPGIREAFIPRAGYVFAMADYSGLELAMMAQACLELVGFSHLADAINANRDAHLEVAARILQRPYDELVTIYENEDHPEWDVVYKARQTGKVANFGFPGGLGAATLVEYARALYNVRITEAEAKNLKRIWLDTFPEFRRYFQIIGAAVERGLGITQLYTRRHRGKVTYCAAANTLFQGLGADVAKSAGWKIARACFNDVHSPLWGSFPVVFAHDEWILEVPEYKAHEAAIELERLMLEAARELVKGVRLKAAPKLARRWAKKAKTLKDGNGRLIPWDKPYLELMKTSEAEDKRKQAA